MNNTIEYRGFWIKTEQDEDATSPRENNNIGTMVCSHRNYKLGDIQDMCEDEFDRIRNSSDYICLPIYMYEHSGITISTKPFNDYFDSGLLGMIYVELERAKKEWGEAFSIQTVEEGLNAEVKEYDQYLTGDVWGYSIYDKNPEENKDIEWIHECDGSFFGEDYCIEEAKRVVDYYADDKLNQFIPGMEPGELKKEVLI
jgi:hypothetical protein